MSTTTDNGITITEAGRAFFCCPECGWSTVMSAPSGHPEEDLDAAERFYRAVETHREEHEGVTETAEVPAASAETAVIPLAVYADPWNGQPGTAVICGACPAKSWFPVSKHGSTLLLEAINEHLAHTRQEKRHD